MAERQQPAAAESVEIEGNRLTVVADGPDRLRTLIELIDGARHSLSMLYYIWDDDEAGRQVRDAVVRAGQRGVAVSLLVDGFGALFAADNFFQPIVETQARFCRFEPQWGRRYLLRNHQKLTLADGERVLIGGFNISSAYFDPEDQGGWRDLGLLVEGPLAADLADYYESLMTWAMAPNTSFRGLRRMLRRFSRARGAAGWLYGGPSHRLNPWVRSVKHDLERGRRLDMIMCYFAPNPGLLRRIEKIASREGARVMTPAKSDWAATMGSARHFHLRLLRRDVGVFEYERTRLHTKLIVIDDIVYLGSANFDMRSLYLNLEIMLRVEHPGLAERMRAYFERELQDSRRITLETDRARRTLWKRLLWGLHYLVLATDFRVARRLNFPGLLER